MTTTMRSAVAEEDDTSWMPLAPWRCPGGELVLRYDAPRAEWLAARQQSIGASELAAVLNLSRFRNNDPFTVWGEKTGRLPERERTRAMTRGLLFERNVVELWLAEDVTFPVQVRRRGLMRSRSEARIAASLDFLSVCPDGRCCIEVKTAGDSKDWEGDEVPLEYQIQGQAQLFVTGRDHVHYLAMGPRFEIEHRMMWRDEDLIETIVARAAQWWQDHIEADNPPPVTDRSADAVKAMFGNPTDGTAELPESMYHYPARAAELKKLISDARVELETMQTQVCAVIGNQTVAAIGSDPIARWSKTRKIVGATQDFIKANRELVGPYMTMQPALDARALLEDHPELLDTGQLRYGRTFNYLVSE